MTSTSAPIHPANLPIPVDLFGSNKHPALPCRHLEFANSSRKIVFRDRSRQGFKGDDCQKDLIFKVHRILNKFTRTELETSLMHKLRQIYVGRSKFRLTRFPGSVNPAFVVALVVIFLVNGAKRFQVLNKLPVSI